MNNTEVMQSLAERSHVNQSACQTIVKSYEEYCEKNITRFSRKYLKAIIDYISRETAVEPSICQRVMENYFDLVGEQMKGKIPFVR
ncbi:hypothetical protein [Candidatus Enterococcus clewellii]|uniref:Uncharacterized protein n=1 Tax=Candidatus Enterococcus clewellii TaxID=1834193 RepID=A0A242K1C9_9ENTE|nr:hypothetical protein [Enterococcus sp. 9E7_DIV0242]OTP11469.1 hypothetical protein A5888_003568 [Enterococcus sp. 9E7_DIV0242]